MTSSQRLSHHQQNLPAAARAAVARIHLSQHQISTSIPPAVLTQHVILHHQSQVNPASVILHAVLSQPLTSMRTLMTNTRTIIANTVIANISIASIRMLTQRRLHPRMSHHQHHLRSSLLKLLTQRTLTHHLHPKPQSNPFMSAACILRNQSSHHCVHLHQASHVASHLQTLSICSLQNVALAIQYSSC
jgi:hypothetical protein